MLDEPTYGFSTEQLTKVSDILSDIENKQVIIVSHNQEFVKLDQIINVTKENDISRIDILITIKLLRILLNYSAKIHKRTITRQY